MKIKIVTAAVLSLLATTTFAAPTIYGEIDASVDYVLSIEIIVKDCLITQYSYTYKPNMSDVIISYTCVFTYDKNNRVVKLKKEYRKHYETIEFIYETK